MFACFAWASLGFEPGARAEETAATQMLSPAELKTLEKAVTFLCDTKPVADAMPGVCAMADNIESLQRLRAALVEDLARQAELALSKPAPQTEAEASRARTGLAVLVAFAESDDFESLARQIGRRLGQAARCSEKDKCSQERTAVEIGAALLEELASLGESPEDAAAVVEKRLGELAGISNEGLSENQVAATDQAVEALDKARAAFGKPDMGKPLRERGIEALVAVLNALNRMIAVAWEELGGGSADSPGIGGDSLRLARMFAALPSRGWDAALEKELLALLADFLAQEGVPKQVARLGELVTAKDAEEVKTKAARILLGAGPWADNWMFDINGTIPKLESGDFAVNADLLLGYSHRRFGVAASGSIDEYELDTAATYSDTRRYAGALESWLNLNPRDDLAVEARVAFDMALYDSTRVAKQGDRQGVIDEDSLLGRGGLLAGLKWTAAATLALGAWLGAGLQIDSFDHTVIDGTGTNHSTNLEYEFQGQGRLRAQWQAWPGILALRLWSDTRVFRRVVDELAISVVQNVTVEESEIKVTQLEIGNRLHLDFEVARFFGFVPAITLGLDVYYLTGDGGSGSSIVPMAGVGIRRVVY